MPPGPCERQQVTAARSPGHESFSCSAPRNSRQLTPGVSGETGAAFAPLGLQWDVSAEPSCPLNLPILTAGTCAPSLAATFPFPFAFETFHRLYTEKNNSGKKGSMFADIPFSREKTCPAGMAGPAQSVKDNTALSPAPVRPVCPFFPLTAHWGQALHLPWAGPGAGNPFPTFFMLEKPRLTRVFDPQPSFHRPFRLAGLFPV